MSRNKGNRNKKAFIPNSGKQKVIKATTAKRMTILDKMIDGKEFESLLGHRFINVNIVEELKDSLKEIKAIRGNHLVCYIANVVKPRKSSVSIENSDDLPFSEMIATIPNTVKELDLVLVTPGGLANQVAKFINKLRPRFDKVNFILLNMCMSAGTIFAMSGDEIIMNKSSHIGPIDPQVQNKSGRFVPAQALLNLVDEIKKRGDISIKKGVSPSWTDLQILKSIDPKEIGYAISASNYSTKLVEEYLYNFKFKTWNKHSTDNSPVTDVEKRTRSKEIAELLCNHSKWNSHGHAITREDAWDVCKLKITHAESIGLDKAMRRMWALLYWIFENTLASKVFISENYCIIRSDSVTPPKQA